MEFEPVGQTARGIRGPDGQPVLRQIYNDLKPKLPEGVVIVQQTVWPDDGGGTFKEAVRMTDGTIEAAALRERGVMLKPAQVNVSVIAPKSRRFWHVHPSQNELWTISYGQLNAGLIDCREESSTFGVRSKLVLTPNAGVYIPAGVAHGFANESASVAVLTYFVDMQFSRGEDSQEWRISPDELPYDFVLSDVI